MSKPNKKFTEPFVGVPTALFKSPAFIALDASAVKLYLDLRLKYTGFNNGNIEATLTNLKHRGWSSQHTLARALRQLEAVGFIRKTRQSIGVHNGSKLCNLYRFTDLECYANPKLFIAYVKATKDYLAFTSLGHALKVIKEASPSKPRVTSSQQKKSSMQIQHCDTAESAPIKGSDGATTASIAKCAYAENASSTFYQILSKRLSGEARLRQLRKHRPSTCFVQKLHSFIDSAKPSGFSDGISTEVDAAGLQEAVPAKDA